MDQIVQAQLNLTFLKLLYVNLMCLYRETLACHKIKHRIKIKLQIMIKKERTNG